MPAAQNHGLNTYDKLNKYLGNKQQKKFSKNCLIYRGEHSIGNIQKNKNAIFVKLYQTNIVIHLEIGIVIIPKTDWNTQTTKRYVNGFANI